MKITWSVVRVHLKRLHRSVDSVSLSQILIAVYFNEAVVGITKILSKFVLTVCVFFVYMALFMLCDCLVVLIFSIVFLHYQCTLAYFNFIWHCFIGRDLLLLVNHASGTFCSSRLHFTQLCTHSAKKDGLTTLVLSWLFRKDMIEVQIFHGIFI